MTTFQITIGPRGAPRLQFEAMAQDSCAAFAQHADLAVAGERVEITPQERMRGELQAMADAIVARNAAAAKPVRPVQQQPAVAYQVTPSGYAGSYGMRCHLCNTPRESMRSTLCSWCSGANTRAL